MNLENAVETTDCPMSLRSETRMNTDYQSNRKLRTITPQVSGFDPDFLPELFLYLSAIMSAIARRATEEALATADPWRSGKSVVKLIGCDFGI